jgi:dTDP-4-dehydrorhamnose reductase
MYSRILITGGSGLLALNWALTVRDRFSVTLGLHERDVSLAGVQTRKIDLESVDHLVRVFDELAPQVVIHTAGLTNVEKCESEPLLAHHVNVRLAENVAQACFKVGIQLVHVSTDHLFSGHESLVDEIHPVAPINVYGRTKAEAESRVLDTHPLALVIRTNFYAWGTSYRCSFSDIVIEALQAGKELTLFEDVFYTPILAEVAIRAVHDLIDLKATGIFNVVGDERISKCEFGFKIAGELNLDPHGIIPGLLTDQVTLIQRPHDMSLSNQKIRDLLGRQLDGVDKHLNRLMQQEREGVAREMRNV